ncbi:MAG: glycine oxidase ThiO [Gemmatimonadetes bacterium]|nr:glycine oxidase ThiO [Gemmatimonadota bacterium]
MRLPDVLVIGGGVIGCAIARRLARDGVRTLLLERDEPGTHASWAAAGMLSPLVEAEEPGPFLSLLLESRRLFPEFARELLSETGTEVGYRDEGALYVGFTGADVLTLEERYRWQSAAGLPVQRLSGAEARELEPGLAGGVRGALRFPEDHQVDNRLLAGALRMAAVTAGAEIRAGVEVGEVLVEGARAVGVRTTMGERIDAAAVVIAAGSWAGALRGLPHAVPVSPVHGQLIALKTTPPLFRHVVHSPRVYLVPRADGRLIVGATVEQVGFRKAVTPAGILSLLGPALEAAPTLADAPLVESWSGLRPGTPDALPILGPDRDVAGLHYATGHYRNGILLAPITADIIAESIGGDQSRELTAFSLSRFSSLRPPS